MIIHYISPKKVKWNQARLLGTLEKVTWLCRTRICALFFLILFFSDPKLDAKRSKRHEANMFSSNEGECRESDSFLKMKGSYRAKRAELDHYSSVFTQVISSNQTSLTDMVRQVRCFQTSCTSLINLICGFSCYSMEQTLFRKLYSENNVSVISVQVYFCKGLTGIYSGSLSAWYLPWGRE